MNQNREAVDKFTKNLMDAGLIVEAGWVGYKLFVVPKNASEVQINETRRAFFAGAQHLFASIISSLEESDDATDRDLTRMDNINRELNNYVEGLKKEYGFK